ncbi:hypothetical protein BRADI_4g40178v3 [Brachypodium distachyon]|uniref:GST N-terminal domain-containing protein n=1 Tax=Brachypodium distachyon TaxID=15368 RepID=A0A0Q3HU77_BRADI|nr:hypothetical protein BRADI_4g40178v3 [Brachypodium distachyon]
MSAAGKPVLYSKWFSSCSQRVRIALNLKGTSCSLSDQKLIAPDFRGDRKFIRFLYVDVTAVCYCME